MDYFKLLNFEREPFSNSPDPGLFYHSKQHLEALQKLEISVRLKRGLNVVIGDVGTGKTTLSRQLIQKISNDNSIKYYLVLDPGFNNKAAFLRYLLYLFQPEETYDTDDETVLKEHIKKYLFSYGVCDHINIVIIIDEGQKLSLSCMEILRELLNFETNDQKLLQIVIFAQNEFKQSLDQVENFKDRINFYYQLTPLNFKESRDLINYRTEVCFAQGKSKPLFTPFAYLFIYTATKGFPRRIIHLCHQIVLSLVIQNKSKAGFLLVRSCILKVSHEKNRWSPILSLVFLLAASLFLYKQHMIHPGFDAAVLPSVMHGNTTVKNSAAVPKIEKPHEKINDDIFNATNEKKADDISNIPEIYGSIRIPKKSTLGDMITIVYGSYNGSYLDKIMMGNPNIQSPERIKAGMSIDFPVLSESDHPYGNDVFMVLSEDTDINSAFQTACRYRLQGINVRILPVRNIDKGFSFPVVINKAFVSMEAAENYKKQLPGNMVAVSKQISLMENRGKK